jgi:flagellar assembly protein FliH
MTLSKIISGKSAEHAQRWRIPDMSNAMPEQKEKLIPDTHLPSELDIVTARENAESEGFKEGYERGLSKGQIDGQQTANEEASKIVEQFSSILNSLQQPLQTTLDEVEQELLELSLAIAKQILQREIKTQPQHLIGIIREAIKQLPTNHRDIVVHLHPDNAHTVREVLHEHKTKHHWDIIDDPAVLQGDCQIRSESAFIDASIDAMITRMAVEMMGGHRQNDPEPPTSNRQSQ